MFLFGIYYLFFSMYLFLDSLTSGNWRAIFAMQSIPCILCVIGLFTILDESPRFNLAKENYYLCFKRLN